MFVIMFSAYSYFSYNLYSASVIISNEKNILRTCCNWTPVLCSKSWKLTLQHECVLGYYIMKITTLLIIVLQAESSGVKFPESKGAGVYLRSSRVRKYFLQCLSPYLEEWRGTGAGGGGLGHSSWLWDSRELKQQWQQWLQKHHFKG